MFHRFVLAAVAILISMDWDYSDAKRTRSKWANHGSKCKNHEKVSATIYFLPREGKVKNFRAAVKLQGSGIMANGNRLSYTGKVTKPPTNCTTTKTSASRQCLLSYFSIAADLRYHRAGDIIEVPSLKGTRVRLPDSGQTISHPGFFIVHDTGAAIKGVNRFDFFTGTDNPSAKGNAFRQKKLGDKFNCQKSWRKFARNSKGYHMARNQIYSLTDSTRNPSINLQLAQADIQAR